MNEESCKSLVSKSDAHEALKNIKIRIAVALDKDRTVFEDCDVPADNHSIIKVKMGVERLLLDLFPKWNHPPFDRRASVGMRRKPSEPSIGTKIARL